MMMAFYPLPYQQMFSWGMCQVLPQHPTPPLTQNGNTNGIPTTNEPPTGDTSVSLSLSLFTVFNIQGLYYT